LSALAVLGRRFPLSVIEAVYRVEVAKALKGDQRAIEFLIKRGEAMPRRKLPRKQKEIHTGSAPRCCVLLQAIEDTFAPMRAPRGVEDTSQLGPPSAGGEDDQIDHS
jgi:hypothetical protein